MDALGHVNNTLYFRYFEDARIAYFAKMGFTTFAVNSGEGPILAQTSCQFIRPVTFPDTLTVGVWVEKIGQSSMQMEHELYSHSQQSVVARASSVVVMVNYATGEKVRVSDEIREGVTRLEM